MKIEPFYCDMHIHTYEDANKRENAHYDVDALLRRVRNCAKGHKAMISLTDHNVINADAYKDILANAKNDITIILGVELHVKANGPKPYHAHAYFNIEPSVEAIGAINELLGALYPNKLPGKFDSIPSLPEVLNSLQEYEFLFLPHGGQAHGTFDRAVGEDERFDDLMMRSIYYNTFDGFTARSCANVDNTVRYFQRIGIDEFTNLLTGSDSYEPAKYPKPKGENADPFTPTWILAEVSFDGLRMALSERSRLYYESDPPESFAHVNPSIETVCLAGENIDVDIDLTPGLNVVIGGSSTGKTLLVEAIARKIGILDSFEQHGFYDKFGIDKIQLGRNDKGKPYYINQSYIGKVVDKSVNHETIDSIQILKDVFPQDQHASEGLDANFGTVRDFVLKMFSAAEAVQQAEEALRRLSAPCNLITEDSIASNPIAVLEPSAELQRAMAWKPAVETRAKEAIADLESMFESNPLLPSIKDEANALRAKIKLGKDITDFEQAIASLFKEGSGVYASEEVAAKQSDLTKRDSFAAVLKNIVDLRAGLADYHSAKSKLLAQEFEDVPKRAKLAGHQLSVVYSFKMSEALLLGAINDVLRGDSKFESIEEVTADKLAASLAGVDRRHTGIRSLSSMAAAVAANLEKSKKRTFSITTKRGASWDELSEGRKTAVLLDLILGFDGNTAPLIIDQPEDNLAADYINDGLAAAIKGSKATRQTIVVTHNATIPLLADAQTVVLCRNVNGKLVIRSARLEGSIDGKRALDWVVEITDGGEPSVQKRFRKYNFKRFGGR